MTFIAYAALVSFLIYGHWVRHNIRRQYHLHRKTSFDIRKPIELMKRADRASPDRRTSRGLEDTNPLLSNPHP